MQIKSQRKNPFDLLSDDSFKKWKDEKLKLYPINIQNLIVEVKNPESLSHNEYSAIIDRCYKYNMAIYACQSHDAENRSIPIWLAEQLKLLTPDYHLFCENDGMSTLRITSHKANEDFIPYTDRSINWHTDGYYHPMDKQIRAMILHCAQSAEQGGENTFIDHEIAYLVLREKNIDYIRSLMEDDVLSIPAHLSGEVEIRAIQKGPVFTIDPNGYLHMRYTIRKRHIEWKEDDLTQAALRYLQDFLNEKSLYHIHHKLEPGQGILCNNVLHKRESFINSPTKERLFYRARYYHRIPIQLCKLIRS